MLIIFMTNYLKYQLASNGIFVCFVESYVQKRPFLQSDEFGQHVLEKLEMLLCKMTLLVQH